MDKQRYTQPVMVGDELDVHIINIGSRGDGIARHENFVIIIPNTQVERDYTVRIARVFSSYALADVVEEL